MANHLSAGSSAIALTVALIVSPGFVAGQPFHAAGPDLAGRAGLPVRVWDQRVTETLDLPTWQLQQLRRRMLADQRISFDDMRALADHGDGLAAYRYAQRLVALDRPQLIGDAAHYYATAALTGRDYAIPPMVRLLQQPGLSLSQARASHIENALRGFALRGDAKAVKALMRFYASGEPFGDRPGEVQALQIELAEAGDADAARALLTAAISGKLHAPLTDAQTETLFSSLEAAEDLGLRATAQNLRRLHEARASEAPETADAGDAARPSIILTESNTQ